LLITNIPRQSRTKTGMGGMKRNTALSRPESSFRNFFKSHILNKIPKDSKGDIKIIYQKWKKDRNIKIKK
jgi:hypothetical protein